MSNLEDKFLQSWVKHRLPRSPPLRREHRFSSTRRFRFDFCILSVKLAIEIDGYAYGQRCPACKQPKNGYHQTITGISNSAEKQNLAIEEGWTVVRFTSSQLSSAEKRKDCVEQVNRILIRMGDN